MRRQEAEENLDVGDLWDERFAYKFCKIAFKSGVVRIFDFFLVCVIETHFSAVVADCSILIE